MTFCSVISLNSNWGIFQILYRIISSGEIIICENAKRVIYDRYGLWVGEKLDVHLDQKIGENKTNTFCSQ